MTTIKLNLKPNGREIEKAEQKSIDFLKSHGCSDKTVNDQTIILKELILNGMRNGRFTPSRNNMTVEFNIGKDAITVAVKNPTDEACLERLKQLDKTIQFIRGYQDPFEAYLLMKKNASSKTSSFKANGLGLARICWERKAVIDFFVGEDRSLTLSAKRSLEGNDCHFGKH